jgi:eukaryotic-like serine/threonine-protein kinase
MQPNEGIAMPNDNRGKPAPPDWSAFSAELDHALELDDKQRELWLAAMQERDPSLAERLRSVLAASQRPGFSEFLAGPPPVEPPALGSGTFIGQSVGNYVIDAEIGRGGMGSVWRAHAFLMPECSPLRSPIWCSNMW